MLNLETLFAQDNMHHAISPLSEEIVYNYSKRNVITVVIAILLVLQ